MNRNGSEGWHCSDCQSWGPFTVDLMTRAMLRDEARLFLDDEGGTDYYNTAFARCPDCERQAPVSSIRQTGASVMTKRDQQRFVSDLLKSIHTDMMRAIHTGLIPRSNRIFSVQGHAML